MPNQLKRDPTRTTLLRRKFCADMKRRFKSVSKAIQTLIVTDDVFGLEERKELAILQERQAWRFNTSAQKAQAYQKWLQQQIDAKILTTDAITGKPWTGTYVESAYRKGGLRAYTDLRAAELAMEGDEFFLGGKAEFLRTAFDAPELLNKIELLSTRTFEELKGVTSSMSQQMSRILSEGLVKGYSPRKIARELRNNVTKITNTRALTLARTEIIHAHAEGQLDAFEHLGVKEITVMAEWSTVGDDRVCPLCGDLEGVVMTVKEARGLIPRHPNCLPPDSLVTPGGGITGVSKRWYDGDMFVFKTSFGDKFVCTPNHPILTSDGFVPANTLDIGSEVMCNSISERERIVDCNDIDKPSRIEDIAESFLSNSDVISVPMPLSSKDFHGDGIGSKVAVISSNCFLGNSFNPSFQQHFRKFDFVWRIIRRMFLNSLGAFAFGCPRHLLSDSCFMCGSNLIGSCNQIHISPFYRFRFTLGSDMNIGGQKAISYSTAAYIKLFGKSIFRHSLFVKFCNFFDRQRDKKIARRLCNDTRFVNASIVHCKAFHYLGYIYNLETTESYYIANNVASHNCRCSWMPAEKNMKQKGQLWGKRGKTAVKKSIKSEGPKTIKRSYREIERRSVWAGKELL